MSGEHVVATPTGLVTIAPAQHSEFDLLVEMLEEVAEWLTSRGIDQWRPGSFKNGPFQAALATQIEQGAVYLAKQEGQIVGTVTLQWSAPLDVRMWERIVQVEEAGYIHRLAIRRAFASKGMGRCLLSWAENTIAAIGKSYARLDCTAENPVLRTYYEQAGFVYRGEVEGKGWKASLYEKHLRKQTEQS